ncbi:MAG: hypothetical protein HKN44_08245 [Ilumatobacter sp.]|nr:hypothetical protein [Ilumatobacter sp.]
MALDDTDRRRFFLAAIVSLLALPALWWANRDDGSAGPNVATAGVEIAGDTASTASPASPADTDTTIGESRLPPVQTVRGSDPVFLDGPAPNAVGVSEIAVPATSATEAVMAQATYRSSVVDAATCLTKTLQPGRTVTIVNLDNNREATCQLRLGPATQVDDLVVHTDLFIELADLTDAPIPVEIRP